MNGESKHTPRCHCIRSNALASIRIYLSHDDLLVFSNADYFAYTSTRKRVFRARHLSRCSRHLPSVLFAKTSLHSQPTKTSDDIQPRPNHSSGAVRQSAGVHLCCNNSRHFHQKQVKCIGYETKRHEYNIFYASTGLRMREQQNQKQFTQSNNFIGSQAKHIYRAQSMPGPRVEHGVQALVHGGASAYRSSAHLITLSDLARASPKACSQHARKTSVWGGANGVQL